MDKYQDLITKEIIYIPTACPVCGYKNITKQYGIYNNFHICTGPMS